MEAWLLELRRAGIRSEQAVPLSEYSTFRIGGSAKTAVFPKSREELLLTVGILTDAREKFVLVGRGSNLLFSDEDFDGAVIFTTDWKEIKCVGRTLTVSAGASLAAVACAARDASLGGAEFLHGIPGTVGGAVFMNAGAFGGEIAHICKASEYFDVKEGRIVRLEGDAQTFGTRSSFYSARTDAVILGAELELIPSSPDEIRERMRDFADRRRASQPLEYPSAGSVFKRPVGHYAGKLIEDCGLKGYAIGGAMVSEKHAGFAVNLGNATATEVRSLLDSVSQIVFEKSGIRLEPEVRIW